MLRKCIIIVGLLPVSLLWLLALLFGYGNFWIVCWVLAGAIGWTGAILYLRLNSVENRGRAVTSFLFILIGLLAVLVGLVLTIIDPAFAWNSQSLIVLLAPLGSALIIGIFALVDIHLRIKTLPSGNQR